MHDRLPRALGQRSCGRQAKTLHLLPLALPLPIVSSLYGLLSPLIQMRPRCREGSLVMVFQEWFSLRIMALWDAGRAFVGHRQCELLPQAAALIRPSQLKGLGEILRAHTFLRRRLLREGVQEIVDNPELQILIRPWTLAICPT